MHDDIHEHEHEHDHHEHHHDHDHHHDHHHDHGSDLTPKEELVAMLKYMVGHNAHHVDEMAGLAEKVKDENPETTAKILEAVAEFRKGNDILAGALAELEK